MTASPTGSVPTQVTGRPARKVSPSAHGTLPGPTVPWALGTPRATGKGSRRMQHERCQRGMNSGTGNLWKTLQTLRH